MKTTTTKQTGSAVAYSYLRFSHPSQAAGDSITRQTEGRDAWLSRNGIQLDTSLSLTDSGVSGFSGTHRTNPDRHALAAFLALVERGRIARGSYLLVESLDRLSREHIRPALSLLLQLIEAGIRVVQLLPVETVYDDAVEPMTLLMAIMELSRGHSESAMKSERVGAAWVRKRERAAASGEPLTARCPAWLSLVDGEWIVREKAAAAVRQIYQWAIDGYGLHLITAKLNAERVPPIGESDHWARSYVARILTTPAAMGTLIPSSRKGGKAKPIKGYYPAVVSEDTYHAARAAMIGRKRKGGRMPSAKRINLFSGILTHALRGSVQLATKNAECGPTLQTNDGSNGVSEYRSYPYPEFERAILDCLREVKPSDVLPSSKGPDRVLALSGELASNQAQQEQIKAQLARVGDLTALVDVLAELDAEAKRLSAELADAQRAAASPLSESWGECQSLIETLDSAPDPLDARVRLRSALRRIIEAIVVVFCRKGRTRLCAASVYFRSGRRRDYVISYLPVRSGRVKGTAGVWRRESELSYSSQLGSRILLEATGRRSLDLAELDAEGLALVEQRLREMAETKGLLVDGEAILEAAKVPGKRRQAAKKG